MENKITATELRIGNYFHPCSTKGGITIPNTELIWRVGMVDKFGKVSVIEPKKHDNINLPINECSPIPLTEEWLLKFGFKTRVTIGHSVQYFIGINPITRDWLFDILWLEDYKYPFYRNGHFEIKHVHQLQNLYFALTNEELTIKQEEK
jgi:hypothetical protein